jgi:hypothetical protein
MLCAIWTKHPCGERADHIIGKLTENLLAIGVFLTLANG